MKPLALLVLALLAFPAASQTATPAGSSTVKVEVAPGSVLQKTVRTTNTTRRVEITVNPQDVVIESNPVHMHGGLNADMTTLRAPEAGFDTDRVKDTLEE